MLQSLSVSGRWHHLADAYGHVIYMVVAWLLAAVEIDWLSAQIAGIDCLSRLEICASLVWAAIFTFPYLFLPGRYRWLQLIVFFVLVLLNTVNCLYYRNFDSLVTLRTMAMWQGVNDYSLDAARASLLWSDAVIWIAFLLQVMLYVMLRKPIRVNRFGVRFKIWTCVIVFLGLVKLELTRYRMFVREWETTVGPDFIDSRPYFIFTGNIWDYSVKGCFETYIIQLYGLLKNSPSLSSQDIADLNAILLSENRASLPLAGEADSTLQANRGKNLLIIVVESLNSSALGCGFGGMPFTPCLDSLRQASDVVCFDNMCSQAMFGQSSDGQFMYNTGIYPLTDEITLSIERRGPFPSLCRELDGYHAEEFIGEDRKLWFHDESSVAYGYDRLTDRLGVHDINRCDEAIMSASLRSLKGLPQPFFVILTTLTMHGPYGRNTVMPDGWIDSPAAYDYMSRLHMFDNALRKFIDGLKQAGLYDNTVIVIASDHRAPIESIGDKASPQGRIMLMILNSGLPGRVDSGVVGQIDVYPTILDIMGVRNPRWPGMGQSLIREVPGFAVVRGTEIVGDTTDTAAIERQKRYWQLSDRMIKTNTFPFRH